MAWPANGEAVIHTLSSTVVGTRKVNAVSLLGGPAALSFTQQPDGLHISLPAEAPGKYAYAYRIAFEGAGH
jgi:alpha-L-fucosidase